MSKVVSSQYVTMFMTSDGSVTVPVVVEKEDGTKESVMKPARQALDEVYAHGWQPLETIPIGIGPAGDNRPQIQLVLHLVKYEEEIAPVKSKNA